MPRPRHITRRLAYASLALALLTAAAWLISGWHGLSFSWDRNHALAINSGWLEYGSIPPTSQGRYNPGFHIWGSVNVGHWRLDYLNFGNVNYTTVGIPFWPLIPLLAALGAILLYTSRKRSPHLCPKCSYDLRGLPSGSPCPECGRAAALT